MPDIRLPQPAPAGEATDPPPERPHPHDRYGGEGMTLIDAHDTRPGGPNRHERDHRVGTPESLTEATKEIGMLQVHTCVSVHCGQCGDSLGSPGFEAHYPTEDAALDAAAGQGWRVGPGGRLWCSAARSTGIAVGAACTSPASPHCWPLMSPSGARQRRCAPCWWMWPRRGRWRDG